MANLPFPGGPLGDTPAGGSDNDLKDAPIGHTDNLVKDSPVGGSTNLVVDNPRTGSAGLITDLSPVGGGGSFDFSSLAEATFSGDAGDVTFGVDPLVQAINNKVAGGPDMQQPTAGAQPTQVTKGGHLAFHCGDGFFLDQLVTTGTLEDFITNNAWHIFTVINFDTITAPVAEDGVYQHRLFGLSVSGHFGLTLHLDTGVKYAQGFANNSTADLTVRDVCPEAQYVLIEYWNSGSEMGIRVNDAAAVTTPWSGVIPESLGMTYVPIVGSVNFAGAWDSDTNVMSELHVADAMLGASDRSALRSYLAGIYGFSV